MFTHFTDRFIPFLSASAGFFSRTFGNVVRFLPPMRIGSRYNQGCVGGTRCQFFVFCWMSGGSLGASCGPLHTCCVTPSSQDIQPQYWGPVVNDPCKTLLEIIYIQSNIIQLITNSYFMLNRLRKKRSKNQPNRWRIRRFLWTIPLAGN